MKRIIIIILLSAVALPLTVLSQQKNGFEINGHLEGLKDGEVVRIGCFFNNSSHATMVDSCVVSNGSFHLSGIVPDGPLIYGIFFSGHYYYIEGHQKGGVVMSLLINNGEKINIHGGDIHNMDPDFENEVSIDGSPSNFAKTALESLYPIFFELYHYRIWPRLNQIKDSVGFDRPLVQGLMEAKTMLDKSLGGALVNAPSYYKPAIPWLIDEFSAGNPVLNYHGFFLKDLYESLDEPLKNSYYGKRLKLYAALAVGQPLPGFTLPTPDGKMITLKDLLPAGKLTLVWLTSSIDDPGEIGLRQPYEKELMALYPKYHQKGLNVIAVSADTSKEDWKNYIQYRKYPWINVSDLKGWKKGSIINDVYQEGGHHVPNCTNILLDENGRIVAWDPTGLELEYYLDKYLDHK